MTQVSDVLRITIQHNGPLVTTDPNGFAIMALIPSVMTTLLRPHEFCKSDASDVVSECLVYTDMDGSLHLTPKELMRLAGLRLHPQEYFKLREKFGIRHPWHEDFYDPATGEALQPHDPIQESSAQLMELLPEGTVIIGLDDPEKLHNTIAEAVGEPPLKRPTKRGKRGRS